MTIPNWHPVSDPDWIANLIRTWRERDQWIVPRSLSVYVIDKPRKTIEKRCGLPEPQIARVFELLGWTVKGDV